MNRIIFRGKRRWEKFEAWRACQAQKPELLAIGCWKNKKGKRLLYIEYKNEHARP